MSQPDVTPRQTRTQDPQRAGAHIHGVHGWMMIACCIPTLVVAIALVATGVAAVGFISAALMCTAMMAMIMRGMSGDSHKRDEGQQD
jgi:hypothetical protein